MQKSSFSEEHGAGWQVYIGDEHIADLNWLRDEDPCYGYFEFTLHPITPDSSKLAYAFSRTASRPPDAQVFLINRATGAILSDDQYFADLRDQSTVRLRALGGGRIPFFFRAQ
jgi:hypothetical protein